MLCKNCKKKANCVGWYCKENLPTDNPKNKDEFYCEEHCEHDYCKKYIPLYMDGQLTIPSPPLNKDQIISEWLPVIIKTCKEDKVNPPNLSAVEKAVDIVNFLRQHIIFEHFDLDFDVLGGISVLFHHNKKEIWISVFNSGVCTYVCKYENEKVISGTFNNKNIKKLIYLIKDIKYPLPSSIKQKVFSSFVDFFHCY